LPVGKVLNLKERSTGNGGGATWDVVLSSSVTENGYNIVQCTGVPTLSLVLRVGAELTASQFGAGLGFSYDSTPALQAMADIAKGQNISLVFDNGEYTLNSTVDLSSPGGGVAGYRDLEVRCDHKARFAGLDNTITLFNIEGQKLFKWSGGRFSVADVCFQGAIGASPQPPDAYEYFSGIIFEPSAAGSINKCYSSTSPIGSYWTDCDFGTDERNDGIILAVDMSGNDVGQSNLAKFTRCTFKGCVSGVNMPDSIYARFGTSFTDCRFESILGYALTVGINSRDVRLTNC
jgi:hypothetical protein